MNQTKTAIVTGITGQDGCYLARLLADQGYRVIGAIDPERNSSLWGLKYVGVLERVHLKHCDIFSFSDVQRLILETEADEIYHLASQSSVAESFRSPVLTMHANTRPIINILESVRTVSSHTRVYHASSSEMFGKVKSLPVTEQTHFRPVSPYAVSKVAAHQTVSCYRDSYGLFAVSGILFNHESVLRRETFFTRKLIREAFEIVAGHRESISFGNLDVRRDFGYAPAYVEAMWRMLQQADPYDFLICSGHSVSLREMVEHVFGLLGIALDRIKVDPNLFRPNDIPDMYGSNEFAKQRLGWSYDMTALEMLDVLVAEERQGRQCRP